MRLRSLLIASAAALLSGALIAQAQSPGVNSTLNSVWSYVYEASSLKPTYSASSGAITPASSATDICTLAGSSTKTIRVRRVIVSGFASSAQVIEPVSIIKRSTVDTSGTGTLMTAVPYDSQSAASTVTVDLWTANPTVGTAVGLLIDRFMTFPIAAGAPNPTTEIRFGDLASAAVLRGTTQSLNVNLSGVTIGGTIQCTFEWTEESQT